MGKKISLRILHIYNPISEDHVSQDLDPTQANSLPIRFSLRSFQIAVMQSLSFLFVFAASSFATKLLLPLYQYPEGTTWDPVYSAIEANPQLDFQIVLNVDSGPLASEPDSNFVTGTSKLNSYPNVQTLGYVHCLYGADQEGVIQNVTEWSAWNAYTGANVSIDGIFFDEIPNTEGGADDVSFVQAVVGAAVTAFGTHQFTSMLNPGAIVEHDEFWNIADYIVIFEDDASAYSDSVLTTNIPSGKAGQSSILIYDFASIGTASMAETWLQAMMAAKVGSAHILDYDYVQATTAETPASIGSVALVLAVSPDTGSVSTVTTSAATTASTSSTVAVTNTKATTITTLVVSSPESTETTPTSSAGPASTGSSTIPTQSASGNHQHHHWWRANSARVQGE